LRWKTCCSFFLFPASLYLPPLSFSPYRSLSLCPRCMHGKCLGLRLGCWRGLFSSPLLYVISQLWFFMSSWVSLSLLQPKRRRAPSHSPGTMFIELMLLHILLCETSASQSQHSLSCVPEKSVYVSRPSRPTANHKGILRDP
jgi:hypothetical protein